MRELTIDVSPRSCCDGGSSLLFGTQHRACHNVIKKGTMFSPQRSPPSLPLEDIDDRCTPSQCDRLSGMTPLSLSAFPTPYACPTGSPCALHGKPGMGRVAPPTPPRLSLPPRAVDMAATPGVPARSGAHGSLRDSSTERPALRSLSLCPERPVAAPLDACVDSPATPRCSEDGVEPMASRVVAALSISRPQPRRRTTPDGQLQLERVVGRGSGGKVFLATAVSGATCAPGTYAVKVAPLDSLELQREAHLLAHVVPPHPHVVALPTGLGASVCTSSRTMHLPLQYYPDGDLLDDVQARMEAECPPTARRVADIGCQLADALDHCHSYGVYHRDVKPDNVLVDRAAGTVALADFGSATTSQLSTACSTTPAFAAPEVLATADLPSVLCSSPPTAYDAAAADVWSLGVTLFCTWFGRQPWAMARTQDRHFARYVATSQFHSAPKGDDGATMDEATPVLLALLRRMLTVDPSRRVSVQDALQELAVLAGRSSAGVEASTSDLAGAVEVHEEGAAGSGQELAVKSVLCPVACAPGSGCVVDDDEDVCMDVVL